KRELGLLPASNHATRSSRVSIGVISTWSRAMRGSDKKGRDLTRRLQGRAIGATPLDAKHWREPLGLALSTSFRVRLPRPARKAKAALVFVVNQIDIRIVRALALGTRTDLEITRISFVLCEYWMCVGMDGMAA